MFAALGISAEMARRCNVGSDVPVIRRCTARQREQPDVQLLVVEQIDPCLRVRAVASTDEENLQSATIWIALKPGMHTVSMIPK